MGLNTAVRAGLGIGAALSALDLAHDIYRTYLRGRLNWAGVPGHG